MDDRPACPRCMTPGARVLARSPVADAWLMFGCGVCFYGWRSTEPPEMSTREGIAPAFRVDATQVDRGRVLPAITPLRDPRRSGDQG